MIVLFGEINTATLPIAMFYRVIGRRIYYLGLSPWLHSKGLYLWLKARDVCRLSFERIDGAPADYLFKSIVSRARTIMEHHCKPSSLHGAVFNALDYGDDLRRPFDIAVTSKIHGEIEQVATLLEFADALRCDCDEPVHVFCHRTSLNYHVLNSSGDSRNLCAGIVAILPMALGCCRAAGIALRITIVSWRRVFSRHHRAPANADASSPGPSDLDQPVIFFPHKGIFYGELFKKDHFYSNTIDSPFHPTKITHLAFGDSPEILAASIRYYEENRIPYADFTDFYSIWHLSVLWAFIRIAGRACKASEWSQLGEFLFYLKIYVEVRRYRSGLRSFSKTRICLVGYDILFPRMLSLEMMHRGIKTVACQERFFAINHHVFPLILDTYMVPGQFAQDHINANAEFFHINRIVPIGMTRMDLFYQESTRDLSADFEPARASRPVLLAMPYHTENGEFENCAAAAHTWQNAHRFYGDLIRLALQFQGIYFVIKGKNADIVNQSEFTELVQRIKEIENIEIITDLQQYTPQRIAAVADAGIALQTNFADEMMAMGKPVVFYDFFGLPSKCFDYAGLPVIAHDYEALADWLSRFLDGQVSLDMKQQQSQYDYLFGDRFDGLVCRRIKECLDEEWGALGKSQTPH